jgi:hypothetical protein
MLKNRLFMSAMDNLFFNYEFSEFLSGKDLAAFSNVSRAYERQVAQIPFKKIQELFLKEESWGRQWISVEHDGPRFPLPDKWLVFATDHDTSWLVPRIVAEAARLNRTFNLQYVANSELNVITDGPGERRGNCPGVHNALRTAANRGHKKTIRALLTAFPGTQIPEKTFQLIIASLRLHEPRHIQPILLDSWQDRERNPDRLRIADWLEHEMRLRYPRA